MKQFNVILYDVNTNELEKYDVIPYIMKRYSERLEREKEGNEAYCMAFPCPKTRKEFEAFVDIICKSQYWSRCQYEIVVTGFPIDKKKHKIDAYYQIKANFDTVVDIVMEEAEKLKLI